MNQREMRGKVPTMKIHTIELPEWLLNPIMGAEGEAGGESGSDSSGSAGGAASASDDGASDDDHDDDELSEGAEKLPDDHPVKKALAAERAAHKADARNLKRLEREAAARKATDEANELASKSELEQAQAREKKATDRAALLADGFKMSAIDRAIEKAATTLQFVDTDDALVGVDRSAIVVEQDTDNPAKVTVDLKSVATAVKALADRKKHLVRSGTEDGEPTGSQFGAGGRVKKKTDDEVLRAQYPSLR